MESLCVRCVFFVLLNLSGLSLGVKQWKPDRNWPRFTSFGQISAVSVDANGSIYVFHRGDREWNAETFDASERLSNPSAGPIKTTTIAALNADGNLITATGQDLFYMPHGLTVDHDLNIWVTDVGLHQALKFPPIDKVKDSKQLPAALITLGKRLTPGKGRYEFCKPTAVAVDSQSGDFFVSDGYCNSRILKYDRNGKWLLEWGNPATFPYIHGYYNMRVPHSLALDEARQQILVADRENSRILCYTTDGQYLHQISAGGRVYGISYSPLTDRLYAVTGGSYTEEANGTIFSMKDGTLVGSFSPDQHFQNVHDVAVSANGQDVYVVELNPYLLWRFTVDREPVTPLQIVASSTNPVPSSTTSAPLSSLESNLGANQIAVTVVTAVVLLGIAAVICHLYRKRNKTYAMEMRGLILEEDEDRVF